VNARTMTWVVLVVVAATVLALVAFGGDAETDNERAQRLARSYACPECVGESVAASNSSTARRMREIIQEEIAAGSSDDEITALLVAKYRDRILLEPERDGIGWIVWSVPIVGLLIGAGGVFLVLRRWSRAPRLVATEADELLVARLREHPTPEGSS
jgi:cytochrome c-type biogenesis protein CcmH